MSRYTSATDADRQAMLEAIGAASVQELFADVPEGVRLGRPLDLPPGKPEQEVYAHLRELARRNTSAEDEVTFLGAGMYDHYVPAIVDSIITRSEFLTPYTPYQPEISQGGLQVMFEYQTAISELTGLPVSNASVYEGPSALAAAGYLAKLQQPSRTRFLVSRGVHPHSRETLATTSVGWGTTIEELPLEDGVTDADALEAALSDEVSAVFLQYPNFLGAVEDLEALVPAAKACGALVIVQCDPIPLGILRPPGDFGVDIAVGEGQTLGNRLDFGGPSFGFFAAQEAHLRRMPGRIAGETTDVDGRRGFVLTLQTREQHIRRDKATHNICTAQALNALAGRDLPELARPPRAGRAGRAAAAAHRIRARVAGRARRRRAPARAPRRARVRRLPRRGRRAGDRAVRRRRRQRRLRARARLPRAPERPAGGDHRAALQGRHRPARPDAAVRADHGARGGADVTSETAQQRDRARTIYEKSQEGRRAFVAPELDVPHRDDLLPERFRRREPARLPEIAEPEIVRHYNRLSKRNFDLDTGFYPLGSCTMKHNPKLHERVAGMAGHARLHPLQRPARAQGALQLMWELQRALAEISGLPHVSLQPSAGSHGELAGVLLTRAYHEDRGEQRTKVLTPDTAHGTNPATVTMAGLEVVKVGTNADGGVDVEDLKAKTGDDVACLMLTNPNTLGLFDTNIEEIAHVVHDAGATLYYDGANLNAVMGVTRPGDMGFDIVHFNLHKTFTQPHGGGGPGAGPIAVSDRIDPFLPRPQIVRHESGNGAGPAFDLDFDRPKSIGRLRGFQGNYGVFVRSFAYILSLGGDGLQEASETAVLNANYLLARLKETAGENLPVAFDRTCMHEFVLTGGPMKKQLGIRTLDLAKRLLDHGFHPPTVYFPLLVDEALLIEPTETETRETLDAFAEVIGEILAEAAEDSDVARNAPYTTPVRRLDEAGAARRPVIRQPM